MASKKDASNDIVESNIGDVVEHVSMNLLIYVDTWLFLEKDMNITWQEIKDIFTGYFKEDIEDWHVYMSVHRSGLLEVACR